MQQCMEQAYQINPSYILRKIAGTVVIVPVGQVKPSLESAMLVPNKMAVFLWKLFQQPLTESEAIQKSIEHYDGPPYLIKRNVDEFIRELAENEILLKEEKIK